MMPRLLFTSSPQSLFMPYLHTSSSFRLCAHSRHEQEVVGGYPADVFKHLALCGAHHIHHVVFVAPLLRCAEHFSKRRSPLWSAVSWKS